MFYAFAACIDVQLQNSGWSLGTSVIAQGTFFFLITNKHFLLGNLFPFDFHGLELETILLRTYEVKEKKRGKILFSSYLEEGIDFLGQIRNFHVSKQEAVNRLLIVPPNTFVCVCGNRNAELKKVKWPPRIETTLPSFCYS